MTDESASSGSAPRVVSAERVVDAPAAAIFDLIADPARQPEWDGNDNLATADSGQRVRAVGDVFTMTLTTGAVREAVDEALNLLDSGKARVAEKAGDAWQVNQWLKKAVLLSFRLNDMEVIKGGPGDSVWWDKVPSKFDGWSAIDFQRGIEKIAVGSADTQVDEHALGNVANADVHGVAF